MARKVKKYQTGGGVDPMTQAILMAIDAVGSGISTGIGEIAEGERNTDIRTAKEAAEQLRKDQMTGITQNIASLNPAKMLSGIASGIFGGKRRERERFELQTAIGKKNQANYLDYLSSKEFCHGGKVRAKRYSRGGKIEGAGTPKSDSVDMKARPGSFIVPSENREIATFLGEKYLGWKPGQNAVKSKPGANIKVSKGEVEFTPGEVAKLLAAGVDLNKLAPNAEPGNKLKHGGLSRKEDYGSSKKPYPKVSSSKFMDKKNRRYPVTSRADWSDAMKLAKMHGHSSIVAKLRKSKYAPKKDYAKGGLVIDGDTYTWDRKNKAYISKLGTMINREGQRKAMDPDSPWSVSNPDIVKKINEYEESRKPDLEKYLPELGGAVQAGLGLAGLHKMGELPELTVADELRELARQTKYEASYGLEPFIMNKASSNMLRSRNEAANILSKSRQGSQDIYSSIGKANQLYQEGLVDLAEKDFQIQQIKKDRYRDVINTIASRKHSIQDARNQRFRENEQALSQLLSTGLENIIGARKLKDELEMIKSRAF